MRHIRLITGLLLLTGAVVLILASPPWLFATTILAVLGLAGWEWGRLAGMGASFASLYAAGLVGISYVSCTFFSEAIPWAIIGALWALFMLGPLWVAKDLHDDRHRPLTLLAGVFVLLPLACLSLILRAVSPALLLWAILMVSAADTGAFFIGRHFGRRKLLPNVSPGKTVVGLFGGLLAAGIAGTLGALVLRPAPDWPVLDLALGGAGVGILAGSFSAVGDLVESYFKRRAGKKNSGALLPGHGGILDRLDSLSAGLPAFVLGLHIMGWVR